MSETITINGPDGSFSAYLAAPASGKGPGVVVLQEIFGVNAVMRGICDDLAEAGFIAVCPDLFWRIEPGIDITDKTQAEWDRAFELFNTYDPIQGIGDIQATITTLRDSAACNGKVGAVGYCLGGLLAYLTACKTDVDAAVGYYGVSINARLEEAANLTTPLMLHIAEEDDFVDAAAQAAIKDGLAGKATLHSYPGRDHAFARVGGQHYHEADAKTANERTLAFFNQYLK